MIAELSSLNLSVLTSIQVIPIGLSCSIPWHFKRQFCFAVLIECPSHGVIQSVQDIISAQPSSVRTVEVLLEKLSGKSFNDIDMRGETVCLCTRCNHTCNISRCEFQNWILKQWNRYVIIFWKQRIKLMTCCPTRCYEIVQLFFSGPNFACFENNDISVEEYVFEKCS